MSRTSMTGSRGAWSRGRTGSRERARLISEETPGPSAGGFVFPDGAASLPDTKTYIPQDRLHLPSPMVKGNHCICTLHGV